MTALDSQDDTRNSSAGSCHSEPVEESLMSDPFWQRQERSTCEALRSFDFAQDGSDRGYDALMFLASRSSCYAVPISYPRAAQKSPSMTHSYYVYILTNRSGTLYVGVTNDLARRLWEHRSGELSGFTSKYRLDRLIHYEVFDWVDEAIAREKQIKGWRRDKKIALIARFNPDWRDLSGTIIE
jgi:putative endonuclease